MTWLDHWLQALRPVIRAIGICCYARIAQADRSSRNGLVT